MKTMMKIIMVLLMIAGIVISIINFSTPESQAKSVFGTWYEVALPPPFVGTVYICTGEAKNCVDVYPNQ